MDMNALIEPKVARARLRLFTLYADFPAGMRAKRLARQIAALAGENWEVSAEMWKLDSISPIGAIRDMIAQEAGESDVLAIAISNVDQPEPAITGWLNSLVNWKANRAVPGLLVGLLGDEDRKVAGHNWMVEQLGAFAKRSQMDLAWQAAGKDSSSDSDWLARGVGLLLERKKFCPAG
jgi:hypothetical protein